MRRQGNVSNAGDLGTNDHLCWTYSDRGRFLEHGIEYLREGLLLGQRLVYVGANDAQRLAHEMEPLGNVPVLVERGQLALFPISDLYDLDEPISPEAQLATYSAANDAAIADGFAGCRVLADVTALIIDPARRPEHARWELIADRYMARGKPFSAMCAYNRREVGDEAVQDIACVHPLVHAPGGLVPFTLHSVANGYAISGEIDSFSTPMLERALHNIPERATTITLDCGSLQFLNHHALAALVSFGADVAGAGGRLVLVDAPPMLQRVSDVFGIALDKIKIHTRLGETR